MQWTDEEMDGIIESFHDSQRIHPGESIRTQGHAAHIELFGIVAMHSGRHVPGLTAKLRNLTDDEAEQVFRHVFTVSCGLKGHGLCGECAENRGFGRPY